MEFKDWISIAGICVSLIWNAFNSVRGEIRASRNTAYAEFGSLKQGADTALVDLRAHKASLKGMQAYEGNDFNEKLKGINEGLSESFEKLISALERLDGSSHSKKKNWADEAYSRWDAFVRALDRVYAPKATLERNKVISAALDELETCLSASQQDLESEGKGILSPPFSIKRAAFLVLTPTIIVTALYWIATRSPAEATP